MASSAAERQRRHRRHRRGDHSLCDPAFCTRPPAVDRQPARQARIFDGPQALYRFFDQDDALLYIGVTVDPAQRFKQHRGEKPWWTDVSRITVEHYPDRASVEQAERDAIAAERPRWNVVHNNGLPPTPARPAATASTSLIVSYGGAEVRLESTEPVDVLAQAALRIVAGLRGEGGG